MNFFDYTSLEDAIPHGLTLIEKITPIIILFFAIYIIYKYQDKIRNSSKEKFIRYTIAGMMLLGEISYMTWNFIHSLDDQVRFIGTLPLHLCSYAIFGLMFVLVTKSQKVYNYIYIFGIVSALALIFPNVNHGFNSFRYYQLFFSHSLLMIALVYMYKIHNFYPKKQDLVKSFILLQIIIVFSLAINILLDTSFLFIGPGNKPIDFAWDWPLHMIQYEVVMFVIYYLFYTILKKIKGQETTKHYQNR